ncbi:hypothetical protein B0T26DRAFT_56530 [Lasiosphaeria miniovina]|uniref:Uncharacterized protein n=1 Tax=Lasiosphaeria miniovina TaxID=1954250 RepID=A0AA40EG76_9PEZI|nr:uncharacterized protein B0T26DRAFT_56530 [Lasiosphaeria miniovina]KAK0734148.1 hypothetical protein B0T26DRAFT_56530 [Lasiosphaeria miniovina]
MDVEPGASRPSKVERGDGIRMRLATIEPRACRRIGGDGKLELELKLAWTRGTPCCAVPGLGWGCCKWRGGGDRRRRRRPLQSVQPSRSRHRLSRNCKVQFGRQRGAGLDVCYVRLHTLYVTGILAAFVCSATACSCLLVPESSQCSKGERNNSGRLSKNRQSLSASILVTRAPSSRQIFCRKTDKKLCGLWSSCELRGCCM